MSTSSHPVARIAYGKGRLPLSMDPALAQWEVISPRDEPALGNPAAAFAAAAAEPYNSPSLHVLAQPHEKVVIVTADGTRPVPNKFLIPAILAELQVPDENITIVTGTGSHRPNTPEELEAMFGADIVRRIRIINHNSYSHEENVLVGKFSDGGEVWMNRLYVEADKRIAVGFIEPHFFAGFSGGAKCVVPGVAGIETILHFHRFDVIAHPNSAYGVTEDNPTRDLTREATAFCPPDFLVNVTLNPAKEITGFFMGEYLAAHDAGCEHVRQQSMVPVPQRYPVVITSNSGFPLDQNLYQAVKALSVAIRVVEDGGTIFLVSECSDGLPSHGNFGPELLRAAEERLSAGELLEKLRARARTGMDQWQVQTLLNTVKRANVSLYSSLDPEVVSGCYMSPVTDLQSAVDSLLLELGPDTPVAVLPEGPLTIPYVAAPALA